jgi:hypothetical protein
MMKTLVITATAMVLAAPIFAQTPQPPADAAKVAEMFAKFDGDKNGTLSVAEVKLADATVTQADFDKYDTDKSKSLSKAEFDRWAMVKPSKPQP